ncbi:MAG: response regulator [Candidatus Cloacimonetes bacterium]|jgi:DNA-binding NarL/FixJ family response regulator|nr:response regulator [Candidatus Cloacimonadota bacterium]MDD4155602.1 response regulator [Candidatus Cloacimonadota bacterium]
MLNNGNIFLIEDDIIDVMVFEKALKKLSITNKLTIFHNGIDCLNYIKINSILPEIMFVDLNTPKMNGIEFLIEMNKITFDTFFPVIIISTSDDNNDINNAYKNHINGYITKSISFEEFTSTLSTVLNYWETVKLPLRSNL